MTKFIIKYRISILVVLMVLTALIGFQLKSFTRDAGISALLPEGHPDYVYWKEMEGVFGASDQIVIGVTAKENIYQANTISLIHELTTFLENLDEIDEDDVISLTTVNNMEGQEGELLIEPLIDTDALDELDSAALESIRENVRTNPLFFGKLVSQDERSTVVIAGVLLKFSLEDKIIAALKEKVAAKIKELQKRSPETTIRLSGTPILKAYISEYMQKDMRKLFPFAIIVVMLMLFLLLRSVYGMLAPILVTLFSIIWTLGLKGFLHSPLTIVETTIPVILIAIGCADGVHIISEFLGVYRKGYSVNDALSETMRLLTLPVILTSVTTALGFTSLLTAPGVSIRNMGVFLAFGVMVAMVFSLFFIPTLTTFYQKKKDLKGFRKPFRSQDRKPRKSLPAFHDIAENVGKTVVKYRRLVSAVAIMALIISILGIINIEVESDEIRYFKAGNPFRRATEHIQHNLGGVTSLDIIIESDEMDIMKQPRILKAMWELQKFCEQDELVSYSLSLTDLIKRINYVLHDNDPNYNRLPDEVETVCYEEYEEIKGKEILVEKTEEVSGFEQVAQFLLLYEMGGGDVTEQYVDDAYQQARINVRLNDMSSQRLAALLEKVTPYIEQHFPKDVTVRYSNHYVRFVMMSLIIKSQIYSLLTVLVTITLLMSLIFRSMVVGVITSLPVFIAVLFNFAVMWLFGVTLNVGTSIVASVGMGVGIDYTIHYFSRFRLLLKEIKAYDTALVKAIAETSRAILSNASAVGLGFLVLLFSEYRVIANIGWIIALSMFTTAFSSLIALPAILSLFKPRIPKVKSSKVSTKKTVLEW